MQKIIFNSENFTSVKRAEGLSNTSESSRNQKLLIRLTEMRVQRKIDRLVISERYPLLLEKLVGFKKRFLYTYFENNSLELKDFFVVLRRICRLLHHRLHLEVVMKIMMYSINGLKCELRMNARHEIKVTMLHERVCEDFWKTKVLETLIVVRNLLQDLYDGVDLDDLTEENLRKSHLVAYCLSHNNDKDSCKIFGHFIAFCQE